MRKLELLKMKRQPASHETIDKVKRNSRGRKTVRGVNMEMLR